MEILNAHNVFQKLADQGIRIFALRLGRETILWIHPNKTTAGWRSDMRKFLKTKFTSGSGWAKDDAFNKLNSYLTKLGYHEVSDVVADVYEGRLGSMTVKIIDDPDHEDQKDGFGHFGWESKGSSTTKHRSE